MNGSYFKPLAPPRRIYRASGNTWSNDAIEYHAESRDTRMMQHVQHDIDEMPETGTFAFPRRRGLTPPR